MVRGAWQSAARRGAAGRRPPPILTFLLSPPTHTHFSALAPRRPLTEYHWIHHHMFSHNYGSPAVPLDKLFGTHFQLKHAAAAETPKSK